VHTHHAQNHRVALRHTAFAQQGQGHRNLCFLHKGRQFPGSAGHDDAVAGQDQRFLGSFNVGQHALDLGLGGAGRRAIAGQDNRLV